MDLAGRVVLADVDVRATTEAAGSMGARGGTALPVAQRDSAHVVNTASALPPLRRLCERLAQTIGDRAP